MKIKYIICLVFVLLCSCKGVLDEEANQIFVDRSGPFSVTVFPVHVVIGQDIVADTSLQRELVAYLNTQGLAIAIASEANVTIPITWGANQAKMFRSSATQFATLIREQDLSTPYALLTEILCLGAESNIGAVHYYIVDTQGRVASCMLSNSHWEDFTSVSPKDRHGGLQVAFNLLAHLNEGKE